MSKEPSKDLNKSIDSIQSSSQPTENPKGHTFKQTKKHLRELEKINKGLKDQLEAKSDETPESIFKAKVYLNDVTEAFKGVK
jgi:hypothetical protein